MKTNRMVFSALRNEEHYQFHSDVKALLAAGDPKILNIAADFADYEKLCNDELEALQLIRKSALSDQMEDADKRRDQVFRGFADAVKSARNHFDAGKKEAAARLNIVMEQYGNVARKPYNEETAAIVKLLKELTENYAADMEMLAITEWANELAARNNAFDTLMRSRFTEESERTTLHMKQVRNEVDAQLRKILTRIDALIIVNGLQAYDALVREINVRFDKYENTVAIRQGKAAAAVKDNVE